MRPYMIPTPESSSLSEIGYDPATEEVCVTFRESGSTYIYSHVTAVVWTEFVTAASKGSFLNDVLKGACPYRLRSR